jgi:hypothetical protein
MDDHEQRLEDILAEWDLDQGKDYESTNMSSISLKDYESMNMSSISLPSSDDTITISASQTSPYTFTGALGASFPNTVYTTAGIGSGGNVPWLTQTPFSAPKIQLNGEGADVEINGWSLVDAVKRIEQRLGLFQPNPELEAEWSELRELGEQYRKLEQHIQDKQATWDRLKAMPAPELD